MVTITKAITVPYTKYKPPWKKLWKPYLWSFYILFLKKYYSSSKYNYNVAKLWQLFSFCKTVPYHRTKHIQYVDRTIYNMKAPSWTYIFFLQYFLFMHKGRDEKREDCWQQRRHSLEIKATGKKTEKITIRSNNNKSKLLHSINKGCLL